MERTVERKAGLGMGWRRLEGLSYHLEFLFSCHHFDNASHMGAGGTAMYQGEGLGVGKRSDLVQGRHFFNCIEVLNAPSPFLALYPCSSRLLCFDL